MMFFSNMFGLTLASFALAWPLYLVAVVGLFRHRSDAQSTRALTLSLLVPLALPYWTAFTVGPHELMPAGADAVVPMCVLGLLAMLALVVHARIWWVNRAARKLSTLCAGAALVCTGSAYVVGSMALTNSWL